MLRRHVFVRVIKKKPEVRPCFIPFIKIDGYVISRFIRNLIGNVMLFIYIFFYKVIFLFSNIAVKAQFISAHALKWARENFTNFLRL